MRLALITDLHSAGAMERFSVLLDALEAEGTRCLPLRRDIVDDELPVPRLSSWRRLSGAGPVSMSRETMNSARSGRGISVLALRSGASM